MSMPSRALKRGLVPMPGGSVPMGTALEAFVGSPQMQKATGWDPALGRGYRIGARRTIPANSASSAVGNGFILANHSHPDEVVDWKIVLQAANPAPGGLDPVRNGASLLFFVRSSVENDIILRRVRVTTGNAQVVYATGRAINVQVDNPQGFDLEGTMAMSEFGPGVSTWFDSEEFENLAAETNMDVPPFCQIMRVYTPTGQAAPRLRGYAPGGVVVVDMTLAVPDSGDIHRIPWLDYTLAPTVGPTDHMVNYVCFG